MYVYYAILTYTVQNGGAQRKNDNDNENGWNYLLNV